MIIQYFISADNLPICSKLDSSCLKNAAETIVRLATSPEGIPAIGIPSLSPLKINDLSLRQGADSPVNIEIIFKDAALNGFEDNMFTKIEYVFVYTVKIYCVNSVL